MAVDRCACHDISFAELKRLTCTLGCDLGAIKSSTGCATSCGMCEPYIRLMLRTGETRFPVLSPSQITKIMAEPPAGPAKSRSA